MTQYAEHCIDQILEGADVQVVVDDLLEFSMKRAKQGIGRGLRKAWEIGKYDVKDPRVIKGIKKVAPYALVALPGGGVALAGYKGTKYLIKRHRKGV